MIKPKYNLWASKFWNWYFERIIASDFQEFSFSKDIVVEPDKAVLLLANHFSWWDGFFIYHLCRIFLKKRFHVMMLEEELSKRTFLTYAGAYSINRSDRESMFETLNFTSSLLENPENLVLMFPQGQIESMHKSPISFKTGVKRVIQQTKAPIQIVFSSALVDYFADRKPTVHLHLKNYPFAGKVNIQELKEAFLAHHEEAKKAQSQKVV